MSDYCQGKKGEIGGICSHTEGKINGLRGGERTGGENLTRLFLEKGDMKNTQYITLVTGGFNLE